MSLLLKCKCGKTLSVKPESAGKKGKCPGCGALFTIPAPAKPASPKMEDPFDIPFANTNASQASGSFWNELQRSTASTSGNSTSDESGAVANRNANRSSNNYLENANREAKERERRERDQEKANGTSRTLIAFIGILITVGLIFGAYSLSTIISNPEFMANFRNSTQTAPASGGGGGQENKKQKLSRKFVSEHKKLLATLEIGATEEEFRKALQALNQASTGSDTEKKIVRIYKASLIIMAEKSKPNKTGFDSIAINNDSDEVMGIYPQEWQLVWEEVKEFRSQLTMYNAPESLNPAGHKNWYISKNDIQLLWTKAQALVKASSDSGD